MKSYTDLEQSKKLAKILPLKSADMYYREWKRMTKDIRIAHFGSAGEKDLPCWSLDLPCWSLSALLEQFPYKLYDDDGNSVYLEINKEDDLYQLVYTDPYGDFKSIETDRYEHFVDACYEMILKLNKLKML